MKINLKFKIGDPVFFMLNDKIKEGTIKEIKTRSFVRSGGILKGEKQPDELIHYIVFVISFYSGGMQTKELNDPLIFKSKRALVNNLINDL